MRWFGLLKSINPLPAYATADWDDTLRAAVDEMSVKSRTDVPHREGVLWSLTRGPALRGTLYYVLLFLDRIIRLAVGVKVEFFITTSGYEIGLMWAQVFLLVAYATLEPVPDRVAAAEVHWREREYGSMAMWTAKEHLYRRTAFRRKVIVRESCVVLAMCSVIAVISGVCMWLVHSRDGNTISARTWEIFVVATIAYFGFILANVNVSLSTQLRARRTVTDLVQGIVVGAFTALVAMAIVRATTSEQASADSADGSAPAGPILGGGGAAALDDELWRDLAVLAILVGSWAYYFFSARSLSSSARLAVATTGISKAATLKNSMQTAGQRYVGTESAGDDELVALCRVLIDHPQSVRTSPVADTGRVVVDVLEGAILHMRDAEESLARGELGNTATTTTTTAAAAAAAAAATPRSPSRPPATPLSPSAAAAHAESIPDGAKAVAQYLLAAFPDAASELEQILAMWRDGTINVILVPEEVLIVPGKGLLAAVSQVVDVDRRATPDSPGNLGLLIFVGVRHTATRRSWAQHIAEALVHEVYESVWGASHRASVCAEMLVAHRHVPTRILRQLEGTTDGLLMRMGQQTDSVVLDKLCFVPGLAEVWDDVPECARRLFVAILEQAFPNPHAPVINDARLREASGLTPDEYDEARATLLHLEARARSAERQDADAADGIMGIMDGLGRPLQGQQDPSRRFNNSDRHHSDNYHHHQRRQREQWEQEKQAREREQPRPAQRHRGFAYGGHGSAATPVGGSGAPHADLGDSGLISLLGGDTPDSRDLALWERRLGRIQLSALVAVAIKNTARDILEARHVTLQDEYTPIEPRIIAEARGVFGRNLTDDIIHYLKRDGVLTGVAEKPRDKPDKSGIDAGNAAAAASAAAAAAAAVGDHHQPDDAAAAKLRAESERDPSRSGPRLTFFSLLAQATDATFYLVYLACSGSPSYHRERAYAASVRIRDGGIGFVGRFFHRILFMWVYLLVRAVVQGLVTLLMRASNPRARTLLERIERGVNRVYHTSRETGLVESIVRWDPEGPSTAFVVRGPPSSTSSSASSRPAAVTLRRYHGVHTSMPKGDKLLMCIGTYAWWDDASREGMLETARYYSGGRVVRTVFYTSREGEELRRGERERTRGRVDASSRGAGGSVPMTPISATVAESQFPQVTPRDTSAGSGGDGAISRCVPARRDVYKGDQRDRDSASVSDLIETGFYDAATGLVTRGVVYRDSLLVDASGHTVDDDGGDDEQQRVPISTTYSFLTTRHLADRTIARVTYVGIPQAVPPAAPSRGTPGHGLGRTARPEFGHTQTSGVLDVFFHDHTRYRPSRVLWRPAQGRNVLVSEFQYRHLLHPSVHAYEMVPRGRAGGIGGSTASLGDVRLDLGRGGGAGSAEFDPSDLVDDPYINLDPEAHHITPHENLPLVTEDPHGLLTPLSAAGIWEEDLLTPPPRPYGKLSAFRRLLNGGLGRCCNILGQFCSPQGYRLSENTAVVGDAVVHGSGAADDGGIGGQVVALGAYPTRLTRTALWSAWSRGVVSGVFATMLDESALRSEPLLRPYWHRRAVGAMRHASEYIMDREERINAVVGVEGTEESRSHLVIRMPDLIMNASGGECHLIESASVDPMSGVLLLRPEEARRQGAVPGIDAYTEHTPLEVTGLDSGTWPADGGGVASCRRDLINQLPRVRWNQIAELGNPMKVVGAGYQTERNVRSLTFVHLWGTELGGPNEQILSEVPACALSANAWRTTRLAIRRYFIPLLRQLVWVSSLGPRELSRARTRAVTQLFVNLYIYFQNFDWSTTWSSSDVIVAWRSAWLEATQHAAAREPLLTAERPNIDEIDFLRALFTHFLLPLTSPFRSDTPVVHSSHHGIQSIIGVVARRLVRSSFVIWDHGVLWRERIVAVAELETFSLFVRNALISLTRVCARVAFESSSVVAPCTSVANPPWEARLGGGGSNEGSLRFARRISPVMNGMDTSRFRPDIKREEQRPTAIMLSHVNPLKDVLNAIRAASIIVHIFGIVEYQLLVYGSLTADIEYAAACRAEIFNHGLGDHVLLLGVGNSSAVLPRGWVFVNSSMSEGLPLAVGEGGLAGLPCVVTDVGGSSLLTQDPASGERFGKVVPARSSEQLARAQVEVLAMLDGLGAEGQNAAAAGMMGDDDDDDRRSGSGDDLAAGGGPARATRHPTLEVNHELALSDFAPFSPGGPSLTDRIYAVRSARRRLGLRFRTYLLRDFSLDRYLREHEQMLWIAAMTRNREIAEIEVLREIDPAAPYFAIDDAVAHLRTSALAFATADATAKWTQHRARLEHQRAITAGGGADYAPLGTAGKPKTAEDLNTSGAGLYDPSRHGLLPAALPPRRGSVTSTTSAGGTGPGSRARGGIHGSRGYAGSKIHGSAPTPLTRGSPANNSLVRLMARDRDRSAAQGGLDSDF
jgi:glycosyltransferase involved in cell wall biosynthesis